MVLDGTANFYIGFAQNFYCTNTSHVQFYLNVYVGGLVVFANFVQFYGVNTTIEGVLDRAYDLSVTNGALLSLGDMYDVNYKYTPTVYFYSFEIRNYGTVIVTSFIGPRYLHGNSLTVKGRGTLYGTNLSIAVNNLTVDPLGLISVDYNGYVNDVGPGAGVAVPASVGIGCSGAGHGGRGGSAPSHPLFTSAVYGNIYSPNQFGSGGGSLQPYSTSYCPGGYGGGILNSF